MTEEQQSELIEPINRELEQLQADEVGIRQSLSKCRERINEVKLDIVKIKYGVEVGSIVIGYKGREYKVTDIDCCWSDAPWLKGNQRKKDGTWGSAARNLFGNWKLKTS
jgi:hypothetical protein